MLSKTVKFSYCYTEFHYAQYLYADCKLPFVNSNYKIKNKNLIFIFVVANKIFKNSFVFFIIGIEPEVYKLET